MKSFITLLLIFYWMGLNAQGFQWTVGSNGTVGDEVNDMVTDELGNIYLVGEGSGIITVTGTPIYCNNQDALIMKFNSDGMLLWYQTIGGSGSAYGYSIALDNHKNVYVTGQFTGTGTFGLSSFTAAGPSDMFVTKLDSTGTFHWTQTSVGPENGVGNGVDVDRDGNVYVTGYLRSGEILGQDTAIAYLPFYNACFFAKYNSNGSLVWSKIAPNSDGADVAVDQFGNVFICGGYEDTAFFSGNVVINPGAIGVGFLSGHYLAKFDKSGNFLWSDEQSGKDLNDMKIDRIGNVYLTGQPYLEKHDYLGNYIWRRPLAGTGTQTVTRMNVDLENNVYITGQFSNDLYIFNTISTDTMSSVGAFSTYLAKCRPNGTFIWGTSVQSLNASSTSLGGGVASDRLGNVYLTGKFNGTVSFNGSPLSNGAVDNFYLVKTIPKGNSISGTVYSDADSNGVKNVVEVGIANVVVEILPGPLYFMTNSQGKYAAFVDTGNFSITIPNPPIYHTRTTPDQTASFSGTGLSDIGNDFGLYPKFPPDLRIFITNINAARPGFNLTYRLTYSNVGPAPQSGTVQLSNGNNLTYINSSPSGTNAGSNTTWTFVNLLPGQSSNIDVTFNVSSGTSIGTVITSTATVNPIIGDMTPLDNVSTVSVTVRGSVDPNDKQVIPSGDVTTSQVISGEFLTYTIRFQNTGTDTAFNIYVMDTLDPNLFIPSFEMLSASAPYSIRMFDAGVVEWTFENVLLPDSNTNELESHGFISYRIKPKSNLGIGSLIKNKGSIFFDYNLPVFTNVTTTLVVDDVNSIIDNNIDSKSDIWVYPNPANNSLFIQANNTPIEQIRIYNAFGSIVSQVTQPVNNYIDVSHLANGIYIAEIKTKDENVKRRWVKM